MAGEEAMDLDNLTDEPVWASARIRGVWKLAHIGGLEHRWRPVRWWHPLDLVRFARHRLWIRRHF